jgi:hypothetical protein
MEAADELHESRDLLTHLAIAIDDAGGLEDASDVYRRLKRVLGRV